MTKYSNYRSTSGTLSRQEREKIHPIWRGIGLILVFSLCRDGWFGSIWLLDKMLNNIGHNPIELDGKRGGRACCM